LFDSRERLVRPSRSSPTATGLAAGNGSSVFPAAPERDLVARARAPPVMLRSSSSAKRHTPEEWDDIIAKMVERGAQASDTEQQQILEYLVRFFGPSQAAAP